MCPQIKKLHAIAASTGGTIFPYATDIMVPIASQSSSILGATTLDQETQLAIHESNLEKMREKKAKDYAKRDAIDQEEKEKPAGQKDCWAAAEEAEESVTIIQGGHTQWKHGTSSAWQGLISCKNEEKSAAYDCTKCTLLSEVCSVQVPETWG